MSIKTKHKISLLSASLLFLPACWNKKQEAVEPVEVVDDGSEVLVSIDGKTKLTVKSFDALLDKIASENEQFKMMLQFMPDVKEQVFKAKKQAIIHDEWATREGIKDSEEYKKKHAMVLEGVRDQLNNEAFVKRHKPEVSDTEVKKFYDENKEKDPRLMKSPEGVKADSIEFKTKEEADAFKDKVTAETFNKVAKEDDLKSKALGTDGLVTENSFQLASDVRDSVLKAKSPSVIVAKDDDKYLVIHVKSKAKASYHDFDQVKDGLKQMLQSQKTEEAVSKATDEYAKKLNIKENTKYFEDIKKQKEEEAKKAAEEFAKAQKEQEAKDKKKPVAKPAKELAAAKSSKPAVA